MGCHTWLAKVTKKDTRSLQEIREYLIKENEKELKSIRDFLIILSKGYDKDSTEYSGSYDGYIALLKSQKHWERYYRRVVKLIPEFREDTINTMLWYEDAVFKGNFYEDVDMFNDIFRVGDYPEDILESLSDCREFLSRYNKKLTDKQEEKIKEFFGKYPEGIIYFG